MAEKGKYLYCIIKEGRSQKFRIKGVEGKDVYTICEGKLSAVVSDSEMKEYFITRENMLAHQRVIEEISKNYGVLPVRFGTVAASAEELKQKILELKVKEILNALKGLEGRIELNLKALWADMGSIFQEIAENSQTIQRLKQSKDINYKEKIAAGELVIKILGERREAEKERILSPLRKIADDLKENKILGDDMILNAAFLVKKEKEKEFDKQVNALGQQYGKTAKFIYVGPLPPFNFSEFHLIV